MLSDHFNDLRYATRRLLTTPGFTAAAILTIALGIGLNTGVFSILNGVFFSGLPVPAAEELVDISETVEGVPGRNEKGRINPRFTTAEYDTLRERSQTLSGVLGYSVAWPVVLGGEASREITGRYVTCNYFDVLRQPAVIGRNLAPGDCDPGAAPVALLSHAIWTQAFAGDPAIVGRTLTLNGRLVTVAGVAAEDAYQPDMQKLDFFAPISTQPYLRPDREWLASDETGWLTVIGRRSGASTIDQVRAELAVIAAAIDGERRQPSRVTTFHVEPAKLTGAGGIDGVGIGLTVTGVLAPFVLVLLVACANVANLFLARANARTSEIALRLSLGASRARLVQQLLTESLLVAIAGGALGWMLAVWTFETLPSLVLATLPVSLPTLSPGSRVMTFAFALSLASGLAAGLGPALRTSNASLNAAMKHASLSQPRHAGARLQGALIGVQVAVCLVLLIGAGLLLRGLYSANTADPGFPYRQVMLVSGDLRDLGYTGEALASFQQRLAEEMSALPDVEAAGHGTSPPWGDRSLSEMVRAPAGENVSEPRDSSAYSRVERNHVTPAYFAAIGIPIVRGRAFAEGEVAETSAAVVVTETTAERFWPGQDPLGRTLIAGAGTSDERALQVIGVAKDAQVSSIGEVDAGYIYLPPQRDFRHMLSLVVKSRGASASAAPEIRAVLERLGVALNVVPLEANLTIRRNLSALVSGLAVLLGVLALVLASVGIFGVVSYVVSRRRREIGIQLALGARSRNVLGVILRRTMRPVVVGAAIGVCVAVAVSNLLSSMLFGVSPVDPIGIGGAVLFVVTVAFVASVLPVRRGLRVDPIATLRWD